MPTSLPEVDEMLEFANKRQGIDIPELKKSIEAYSKKHAKLVRSERLMTYLYLKNELGLQPKIATVTPSEPITIDELKKTIVKSRLSTQGFVIRQFEFKTKEKKRDALGFVLMDKTGSMTGFAYFDDALKNWKEANLKQGDFVFLGNFSVNEFDGGKNLRISGETEIKKQKSKFAIEDMAIPISKIVNGQSALIQVTLLDNSERKYIGCPECLSKLEAKEGNKVSCKKCGDVIAEELSWVSGLATDGEDDLTVSFSPRYKKTFGQSLFDSSIVLTLAGTLNDGEFAVDYAKPCSGFGFDGEKLKEKFETGKPSVERVASQLPNLIKTWDEMSEKRLIESAKGIMRADEETIQEALKVLLAEGKVKFEKGVYKIPDEIDKAFKKKG